MNDTTRVCIVGGGPAGMVLGYLLARQGIRVTILEAQGDFDREFRGDTLHSTTLEFMDDLGLARRTEALLQAKLDRLRFITREEGAVEVVRLDLGGGKYPFVGLAPQARFLDMLAEDGRRFRDFDLRMKCTVKELIEEDGAVRGVRYDGPEGPVALSADLVVGADGCGSRVRALAGIEVERSAPPMDIVWLTLPIAPGDAAIDPLAIRFGEGATLVMIHRGERWQLGYVIMKGRARELREAGVEAFRARVARLLPQLEGRLAALEGWKETQILAVAAGRVARWWRPGLLLIGDAAHIMSPVGGVGINYAIQDAVATANILTDPLRARPGPPAVDLLAAVQARREWPTKMIQLVQERVQERVVAQALRGDRPFRVPLLLRVVRRIPLLRAVPGRVIGRGFRVERLRHRAAAVEPVPVGSA